MKNETRAQVKCRRSPIEIESWFVTAATRFLVESCLHISTLLTLSGVLSCDLSIAGSPLRHNSASVFFITIPQFLYSQPPSIYWTFIVCAALTTASAERVTDPLLEQLTLWCRHNGLGSKKDVKVHEYSSSGIECDEERECWKQTRL